MATTLQILLARFSIHGVIYFGNDGSLDKKTMVPGDVSVPQAVAFTGVWNWKVRRAFAIIYGFHFLFLF